MLGEVLVWLWDDDNRRGEVHIYTVGRNCKSINVGDHGVYVHFDDIPSWILFPWHRVLEGSSGAH